jgi:cytosine/uracil/thiamine/allantoin permease
MIVRAIVALLIGVVIAAIAEVICRHFALDPFWGWLVGVAVGLAYFFGEGRL